MDEKSAKYIIDGAEGAFSFAILGGSIRAGEAEENTMGKKEITVSCIVELVPVVTLEKTNGREK